MYSKVKNNCCNIVKQFKLRIFSASFESIVGPDRTSFAIEANSPTLKTSMIPPFLSTSLKIANMCFKSCFEIIYDFSFDVFKYSSTSLVNSFSWGSEKVFFCFITGGIYRCFA